MANADRPCGFIPRRHMGGGQIRAQDGFKILHAYATSLFRGDAVVLTSGFINRAADNSAAILGVFAGCRYFDNATKRVVFSPYWPASQATDGDMDPEAFVYVDRNITYYTETDTDTAYVDATHKGGSYDIELDHAGSVYTGQSGMEIDLGDTGTGHFKVLGLVDEPSNAAGVNAKIEVVVAAPLYQL